MCNYTTYIRACLLCQDRETVLISEIVCANARQIGAFGSCGTTDHKKSETSSRCWKCKDGGAKATSLKVLMGLDKHNAKPKSSGTTTRIEVWD